MQRGRFSSSNRGSGGRWAGRGGARGRARGGRGGFSNAQPKGLFENGSWLCNCAPRLPAVRFQVKKEGNNKGRWFYTCQQTEPNRCDFFLWDEDAKPREEAAVLSNSRNEPGGANEAQVGWGAGRGREEVKKPVAIRDDSPTPTPSPSPIRTGLKRSSKEANLDVIDDDDWDLDGNEEAELARVADSLATPHKAVKTGVYATPGTTGRITRTLPWLTESASTSASTPSSSAQKSLGGYLSTPSKPPTQAPKQANSNLTISNDSIETETQSQTQAGDMPSSNHRAIPMPSLLHTPSPPTNQSLTSQILPLLPNIPQDSLSAIRDILANHDLRYQGVFKGRDVARAALQGKEKRITELEMRIVGLEGEREVLKGLVGRLRKGNNGSASANGYWGEDGVDDEL